MADMNNPGGGQSGSGNQNMLDKLRGPQWRAVFAAVLIMSFFLIWSQYLTQTGPTHTEVTYSQFEGQLDAGNVKSVTIGKSVVTGEFKKPVQITPAGAKKAASVTDFRTYLPSFQGESLLAQMKEKDVAITVEPPEEKSLLWQFVVGLLPWVLIIGVWVLIMRRAQHQIQGGPGGLFSFGASKAKLFDIKKPSVTFKDVAGMENTDRVPERPGAFQRDRRQSAEGRAPDRSARHGKDPARAGHGGRGRGPLLQHQRIGIYRDVCRRRRLPGEGHVPEGQVGPSEHHIHR
jgi:hypothetical protein